MRRATLILFGTAASVALVISAVAAAARPPIEVTHSQTATANDQTLVEAKCPHGSHPVSGGFEFKPGDGAFAANSAEGIDLNLKRWSLTTISASGPTRVTSHAYCSPLGGKVQFRSDRTDLNQGDEATITATCKRSERVISGGYAFVSSGLALGVVDESFRSSGRSWTIRGTDFTDATVTMLAFAHCVPKQKSPKLTTARTAVPFDDAGGPADATASCGPGHYALSGGYRSPGSGTAFFGASRRVGTRDWRVTDSGGILGRDGVFTALAYCARK